MRAVVITRHGGPEVLQVQERPDPVPGPGEVVVEVEAAGVNFADVMARLGLYPDAPKPPSVIGYEVAGVVEGTDERVLCGTRFGGYAEKVSVARENLVPLPEDWSFAEGAALAVNYATAYAGLIRYGSLQRGERVLIHAAAGGVGIAATQIAKHAGAEVWGTASPHKHASIAENGVDHPLDYTRTGWERGVPKLDIVLDALGGRSFRRSYSMLRAGGRLVCFGASGVVRGDKRSLSGAAKTVLSMPRFNLVKQMRESKTVIGLNTLTLWDEFGSLDPWLEPLQRLIAEGAIRPVVDETFPFERAGEAHGHLSGRKNVGKVVLTPEGGT